MTLLPVNADGCLSRMRDGTGHDLADRLSPEAPAPILIHGFRYAPGIAGRDPHDTILSPAESLPDGGPP